MNVKKIVALLAAIAIVGSTTAIAGETATDSEESTLEFLSGSDDVEGVVEGHTVYSEIVNVNQSASQSEAAAVVVYVENVSNQDSVGNVLWFDDSFLHRAAGGGSTSAAACGGSVWAVPYGVPFTPSLYEAKETYKIDDPNGATWMVTAFNLASEPTGTTVAWAVEVACNAGAAYTTGTFTTANYPASGAPDVGPLPYNALLWFFTADLPVSLSEEHGTESATSTEEGNSHPYNPVDSAAHTESHQQAYVDLYFEEQNTVEQVLPVVFDNNEDFAAYHDHDGDGDL